MQSKQRSKLLELISHCANVCDQCLSACLREKASGMLNNCIKLDIDCSQICRLTGSFIARGSEHAKHLLRECAEICRNCAEECSKHHYMEHCRQCAATCLECAEACEQWYTSAAV